MQDSKIAAGKLRPGMSVAGRQVTIVAKRSMSGHFGRCKKGARPDETGHTPVGAMTAKFIDITFEDGTRRTVFPGSLLEVT